MTKDDAWSLSETPAKEIKVTPSSEVGQPDASAPEPDARELLRQRIEAEELAKFEEERMRAEIRSRLAGQSPAVSDGQQVSVTPVPGGMPVPIVINVDNSNTNTATANATAQGAAGRQHPSTIIRLIYFLFVGWWVGPLWVLAALFMCATIIGLPIGLMMLSRTTEAFML